MCTSCKPSGQWKASVVYVCVCVRALEVSSRSECVYWSEVSLDLEPPTLDTLRQSCPSSSCPRPSPARLTQRLQSADNTHLQLRTSAAHTQILTDTHTPLTMRNSSSHERSRADTNPHTGTRTHLSVPTHLLLSIRSFFLLHPSLFIPQSNLQVFSFLVSRTKDTCAAAHSLTASFFPLVVSHPHQQSSPLNSWERKRDECRHGALSRRTQCLWHAVRCILWYSDSIQSVDCF